jgi:hypothetical protein
MWTRTNVRENRYANAIAKIETVVQQQQEVADYQREMAVSFKTRARNQLAENERAIAARSMRRSVACDLQAAHVEEVISATSAHLAALQLSSVHQSSLDATGIATATLKSVGPHVDQAIEKLDAAADMMDRVQEMQAAFQAIAPAPNDDDELLAMLAPPAHTPAAFPPAVAPLLPAVPTADPVAHRAGANDASELNVLLTFA